MFCGGSGGESASRSSADSASKSSRERARTPPPPLPIKCKGWAAAVAGLGLRAGERCDDEAPERGSRVVRVKLGIFVRGGNRDMAAHAHQPAVCVSLSARPKRTAGATVRGIWGRHDERVSLALQPDEWVGAAARGWSGRGRKGGVRRDPFASSTVDVNGSPRHGQGSAWGASKMGRGRLRSVPRVPAACLVMASTVRHKHESRLIVAALCPHTSLLVFCMTKAIDCICVCLSCVVGCERTSAWPRKIHCFTERALLCRAQRLSNALQTNGAVLDIGTVGV